MMSVSLSESLVGGRCVRLLNRRVEVPSITEEQEEIFVFGDINDIMEKPNSNCPSSGGQNLMVTLDVFLCGVLTLMKI